MKNKIIILGSGEFFDIALDALTISNIFEIVEFKIIDNNFKTTEILDNIVKANARIVLCIGFDRLIPKFYLDKIKFLNFHPSILPKYRGRHSVVWAILNDETKVGYSIHEVNEWLDDGAIIYAFETSNKINLNSQDIFILFLDDFKNNISLILSDYLLGKCDLKVQNKSEASWVPKRTKKDLVIDFTMTTKYYVNFLRAIIPRYSYPIINYKNQQIEIRKAFVKQSSIFTTVGIIVNIDLEGIWITCLDGYLIIQEAVILGTDKLLDYSFFKLSTAVNG